MQRLAPIILVLLLALPLAGGDLEIGWIHRSPAIDYVWDSTDPAREGWPAENAPVTWIAYVKNSSEVRLEGVAYEWLVDGVPVAAGSRDFGPGATVEIPLSRPWSFTREELTLSVGDDELSVFTDALAVGFYAEQSHYDFIAQDRPLEAAGVRSFEGYMQLLVDIFNDSAAIAIYPETPEGVIDRLRVDRITVVPDGALPLAGVVPRWESAPRTALAARFPNLEDRTVDLQWGFSAETVGWSPTLDHYLESAVLHEMGHARYLVDLYGWDVGGHNNDILEMTPPPPRWFGSYAHFATERGWMNQQYTFIDRYSAAALNRIAGFRARVGNYNPPENMGEFLNDLPAENRVRILDKAGQPVRNAPVRLYRAVPVASESHYIRHFDGIADETLTSDGNGVIVLPRNPFSNEGPVVHDHESGSNTIVVVQVTHGGAVLYGYLESFRFNLAYWRGETESAEHDLVVGAQLRCHPSSQPWVDSPRHEAVVTTRNVRLQWLNVNFYRDFEVWASVDNGPPELLGTTFRRNLDVVLRPGKIQWWVIGFKNECVPTRSNVGRFSIDEPVYPRRRPVRR